MQGVSSVVHEALGWIPALPVNLSDTGLIPEGKHNENNYPHNK